MTKTQKSKTIADFLQSNPRFKACDVLHQEQVALCILADDLTDPMLLCIWLHEGYADVQDASFGGSVKATPDTSFGKDVWLG